MPSHRSASRQVPNKYPNARRPLQVVAGSTRKPATPDPDRASVQRESLTDKRLRGLKPAPAGARYTIYDGRTGLAVRVTDKGERSWVIRPYLGGTPRQVLATLGTYPETTLEDARTLARGALRAAEDGYDPRKLTREKLRAIAAGSLRPKAAARGETSDDLTFGELARQFLASPKVAGKASEKETARIVNTYFLTDPTDEAPSVNWKDAPVADLDRREINAALEALVLRGRVQANQCARTLNRLFRWAAKTGRIEAVPVFETEPGGREQERDRELSPVELRAVWKASFSEPVAGPYLRFVLATGLRRNEAAGALREKLDRKARTLAVTVKGGREFVLPLNAIALEAIDAAPKFSSKYIFASKKGPSRRRPNLPAVSEGAPLNGWSKTLERIREASKTEGWTLHDARRTLRTGLAKLQIPEEIAERCLAHVVGTKIARTYNKHAYLEEKRAAFDRWGAHLRKILKARS